MAVPRCPRLRRRHGPTVGLEGDVGDVSGAEQDQGLHCSSDVIGFVWTGRNLLREDFERCGANIKLNIIEKGEIKYLLRH